MRAQRGTISTHDSPPSVSPHTRAPLCADSSESTRRLRWQCARAAASAGVCRGPRDPNTSQGACAAAGAAAAGRGCLAGGGDVPSSSSAAGGRRRALPGDAWCCGLRPCFWQPLSMWALMNALSTCRAQIGHVTSAKASRSAAAI